MCLASVNAFLQPWLKNKPCSRCQQLFETVRAMVRTEPQLGWCDRCTFGQNMNERAEKHDADSETMSGKEEESEKQDEKGDKAAEQTPSVKKRGKQKVCVHALCLRVSVCC